MQSVWVQKVRKGEAMPPSVHRSIQEMFLEIERRAFSLFEKRGCVHGKDVEDWQQAERDVVWVPDTGVIEKESEFRAQLLVDGLEARDIRVIAFPHAVLVHARLGGRRKREGAARAVLPAGKRLFRRLDLPCGIDVDKVTATLDHGTLCITASKAKPETLPVAA